MLLPLDLLVQRLFGIVCLNGNFGGANSGTSIYFRSNEVDSAARDCKTSVDSPLYDMQPTQGRDNATITGSIRIVGAVVRQERRVQVDDALWILGGEFRREDAHPARQHDNVNLKDAQQFCQSRLGQPTLLPG